MHQLVHGGVLLVETLFLVGWTGSIIVVLISGVEDLHTILQKDSGEQARAISGDQSM